MRQICLALIMLVGWGAGYALPVRAESTPALAPYGPLRLVNQQPLQVLFLQPFPDLATLLQPGQALFHLNTSLTNILLQEERRNGAATLDLEMLRAALDLRYGLLSRLEIGMEIPVLYTYGGILDAFIEGFEDLVDALSPLRDQQNDREVSYQVVHNGRQVVRVTNEAAGLGDVVVKVKFRLLAEREWQPLVSLRAALKFPTGTKRHGFGSGGVDGGIGLLLQKTVGRLSLHVNGDVVFPEDTYAAVDVQPFVSGMVAVELRVTPPLSLVLQLRGDSRPFHASLPILDRRLFNVLLGANWAFAPYWLLQGGLVEDAIGSGCCAADVSFFLNLSRHW